MTPQTSIAELEAEHGSVRAQRKTLEARYTALDSTNPAHHRQRDALAAEIETLRDRDQLLTRIIPREQQREAAAAKLIDNLRDAEASARASLDDLLERLDIPREDVARVQALDLTARSLRHALAQRGVCDPPGVNTAMRQLAKAVTSLASGIDVAVRTRTRDVRPDLEPFNEQLAILRQAEVPQ